MDVRVILTALIHSRWQVFSHTKVALIGSAPLSNPSLIKERITSFPLLIAVDGGINHCAELDIRPDLIVGDFDSADPKILKKFKDIPQKHFPRDKDQTDLEIAIELAFHAQVEEMTIFGALQGRTDHALSNLLLLSRFPGKLFLESDSERLFFIDREVTLDVTPQQQISLIPFNGPASHVHTQGLKWELQGATLHKHFFSISNEATQSQVRISFQEGDLLCCLNTFQ